MCRGDLALAEFIQSAWETTKNVPGVGALFGELAEENRVFIEKTKRDELALRKSIAERDARIRQGKWGTSTARVQQAPQRSPAAGSRQPSG
ncbi:hypothetical protein O5623_07350 [Escherichia coli]|nr:hypothetical protein [Escherichia coli]